MQIKGMLKYLSHQPFRSLVLCLLSLSITAVQASAMEVRFVARLANFDGIVPSLWSKIAVDKERTEVFTLNPRNRDVRIFNATGMEIFGFGDDVDLAGATDLDLGEDGNIYVVYPRAATHKVLRLDYKGELLAKIEPKSLPPDFQALNPDNLQFLQGKLYLADSVSMDVVVTDTNGVFENGYHLKDALMEMADEFEGRPGEETINDPEQFKFVDMFGFCVDQEHNIYFTIPALFSAFKLNVDGDLQMFGAAGSGPGKFGVVAGITTDQYGNIYVTDRLRSVVMIFDPAFNFLKEFGYRGFRPGSLIVPDDVVVDDRKGLIYVAQAANRGVNVYAITDF